MWVKLSSKAVSWSQHSADKPSALQILTIKAEFTMRVDVFPQDGDGPVVVLQGLSYLSSLCPDVQTARSFSFSPAGCSRRNVQVGLPQSGLSFWSGCCSPSWGTSGAPKGALTSCLRVTLHQRSVPGVETHPESEAARLS